MCGGAIRFEFVEAMNSTGHRIFASPAFQSERKRGATPFGAGYSEYQPDFAFVEPAGEQNTFDVNFLQSSNIAQVT